MTVRMRLPDLKWLFELAFLAAVPGPDKPNEQPPACEPDRAPVDQVSPFEPEDDPPEDPVGEGGDPGAPPAPEERGRDRR